MKKIISIFLYVSISCFAQNTYASSIEDVIVEAKGTGKTREEAIKAALAEAVAKVNGVSVKSEAKEAINISTQAEEKKSLMGSSSSSAEIEIAKSSKQDVQIAASGIVKTYNVISEKPSKEKAGYTDVVLSVTMSKYKESAATKRKRIAVVPFKLKENTNLDAEFSDLLSKEIVNFLTQSRRFAILDRDYLADKHGEFNLLLGDDAKKEEKARIGNTLGTDYILTGTLLYANTIVKKEKVPYTSKIKEVLTVEAALSWRLIEVATGQVLLSKSTHFKLNHKGDADVLWMNAPAESMGEEIARDLMNNIYPLMPVAYSNKLLTIAQGGDTLKVGQVYTLIKYGSVIYDPYTKEAVGRDETISGTVEITQVSPKLAHAKIVKSTLTENDLKNLEANQYILRPLDPKEIAKRKQKPAPVQTQQPNW